MIENDEPNSQSRCIDNSENGAEKTEEDFIDNKVLRMMKLMGYRTGSGLGKQEQGITIPIILNTQSSKKGLGLKYDEENWDFSLEEIVVEETVTWLEHHQQNGQEYNYNQLKTWVKEGPPVTTIINEDQFCDRCILHNVLNAKNIFDNFNIQDLNRARARANPFETIRSVFFMNRAALKMANIDTATGFLFTNIDENVQHQDEGPPYYFADVCAGPGGFSEYILWRKKWLFKGFGLTLKDHNDFRLYDSICVSPTTFQGLYGARGDGNICCPENIRDFSDKLLHDTNGKGVHFLMADGGFSVEGNEEVQEVLSKNIYICQCLVGLEVVREHGFFVTKLFDIFTAFSVGLLYLMRQCFEKIAIFKPNSSRPANSERYFIGYGMKNNATVENIRNYLRFLVEKLWKLQKDQPHLDIIEIVPLELIKNDKNFFDHICDSNNRLGQRQVIALKKLEVFCKNPNLVEMRQNELREECLKFWQIPDMPKTAKPKQTVEDLLSSVENPAFLLVQQRELNTLQELEESLLDQNDWEFICMQQKRHTNSSNFFAGIGAGKAYKLQNNKWTKVKNLQLVPGTLLYGEFVKEKFALNQNTIYKTSLHVIDALRLGDLSLAEKKFSERQRLLGIYCKAVNREFSGYSIRIRPKICKKLNDLNKEICSVDGGYCCQLPPLGFKVKTEMFDVNSILFLKVDDNQSFHSTYILRMQLFLGEQLANNEFNLQDVTMTLGT